VFTLQYSMHCCNPRRPFRLYQDDFEQHEYYDRDDDEGDNEMSLLAAYSGFLLMMGYSTRTAFFNNESEHKEQPADRAHRLNRAAGVKKAKETWRLRKQKELEEKKMQSQKEAIQNEQARINLLRDHLGRFSTIQDQLRSVNRNPLCPSCKSALACYTNMHLCNICGWSEFTTEENYGKA